MSSLRYDAVIFDLDGTLLDTLADLRNSTNYAVGQSGIRPYSMEEVRSFVGNGIRRLMQQVVPQGEANPEFEKIFEAFKVHYNAHCMDETKPYPGIMELLEWLKKEGCRTAIVSNKADFAVKKLRDIYFGPLVDVAIGEREGISRKPAPDSVYQALKELGVDKARAVYVGDSDVDLHTAQNAGMEPAIVTWGFRSRAYLLEQGADPARMAADVRELKELLVSG